MSRSAHALGSEHPHVCSLPLESTHTPPVQSVQTGAQKQLPLVSILIRSMDRDYLTQALASIALQTYPHIEVVVLSVRPGHRPLDSHCGPFPIRLVPTDAPVLRSAAANRAMAAARGSYLIFLDDDDWMMPGHIARLAEVLLRQPHAQAVYTGIGLVDGEGKPMGQVFDIPFDGIRQLAGNLTPIHSVLFKASVAAHGCRFDEALDRLEDWDFWLQLAKLAPMVHLPGVSAVYRIHESSGVHNDSGPLGEASGRIYAKWETQWSAQQIGQIMQRVWAFPEMEARAAEARAQLLLAEQGLASSQATVAQQMACITQQTAIIEQQASNLANQQAQADAMLRDVQARLAHVEEQRLAMLRSSSWRLTRPVRWVGHVLKRSPLRAILGRVRRSSHGMEETPAAMVAPPPQAEPDSCPAPAPGIPYGEWARTHDTPSPSTLAQWSAQVATLPLQPLVSIVMPAYNPPLDLLEAAVASIQAQIYPHWELCIADDASPDWGVWATLQRLATKDPRIKVVRRPVNGHISLASNSALELASGEFIALMDNDDILPPDALYWVVEAVNRCPDACVLYSDEDKLDSQGARFGAYFKPDWNYTLFMGQNLISHLGVYRTQLVREVGGFRQGLEGSQDYDLALRCIEKIAPSQIIHIPKVLYHWRAIETSTALNIESKPYALHAAQRALQEHLVRTGGKARVEIMPSLNYRCVRSDASTGQRVSLILMGAAEGSDADHATPWIQSGTILFQDVQRCAHDAASVNTAIAAAQGNVVALIRSDLTPATPTSLSELIGHALEAGVGAAAGTVRGPSGNLQSGGFILNPETVASVMHRDLAFGNHGYSGRGHLAQELTAIAMDCVVLRKEVFETHGGFDRDLDMECLGAVAWCLRLRETGLRMVWCPEANWTTAKPDSERTPAPSAEQQQGFLQRYGKSIAGLLQRDPAYHPLLNPVAADFSLRV